jgi:hypothetical protein
MKGNTMTNENIAASTEPQKPVTTPPNPQQNQNTPKPASDKPGEQQK